MNALFFLLPLYLSVNSFFIGQLLPRVWRSTSKWALRWWKLLAGSRLNLVIFLQRCFFKFKWAKLLSFSLYWYGKWWYFPCVVLYVLFNHCLINLSLWLISKSLNSNAAYLIQYSVLGWNHLIRSCYKSPWSKMR